MFGSNLIILFKNSDHWWTKCVFSLITLVIYRQNLSNLRVNYSLFEILKIGIFRLKKLTIIFFNFDIIFFRFYIF